MGNIPNEGIKNNAGSGLDRLEEILAKSFDIIPGEDCTVEDESRQTYNSKTTTKTINGLDELYIKFEQDGNSLYDETAYELKTSGPARIRKQSHSRAK